MAKMDIALDLGTSFTSIFVSGNGIVLHEPSVIAYFDNGGKKRMRAVGSEAYYMIGKAPDKTKVVCPIMDGTIKDADACADMLSEFISKILPQSYLIKPRIRCILGMPMGVTVADREMYEDVLMRAGIDEITMVNSVILAAIGTDMPVSSNFGGIITTIGGGVTEIAILSLCGIVSGYGINIGGDMIDRALMDRVSGKYKINIGRTVVRDVRERVCSLIRNDCATTTVSGIDVESKNIRTQSIAAHELYGVVYDYYKNISDAVESVINASTPTVAAEIQRTGINVVGGCAKIPGLKPMLEKLLRLKVTISGEAEYATVLGGGKLLSDDELLYDIVSHQ
ncbi:MAG: rod shape-determining protein [Clostridiales bacterium]|nr:rod shape-determining protein [Clostridiales bacterium]